MTGLLSEDDIKAGTLKALTDSLQKLNISKQIVLNDSHISVDGLMILTSFLSVCPDVVQVDISLTGCALRLPHLDRLCENLRDCSALTMLDISNNALENKGLKKLLDLMPHLSNIQEINVSENAVRMEGVVQPSWNPELTQEHE
ncbi:protein NLRC5-like [Oncorhynchus keta]|uniref:protein NLRC5-like n=1 Tax=Oncorhynchus keta TaxID=8018 RepID=UPI00227AB1B1|nr:protein NLRC5-like [Oncorhynchus keta]